MNLGGSSTSLGCFAVVSLSRVDRDGLPETKEAGFDGLSIRLRIGAPEGTASGSLEFDGIAISGGDDLDGVGPLDGGCG